MLARFGIVVSMITLAPLHAVMAGPVLWQSVEAGMTSDEVKALYVDTDLELKEHDNRLEIEDVRVLDECKAEANIFLEDETVSKVEVKGRGSMGGRCADAVFAALVSKYGEPNGRQESSQNMFRREASVYVWDKDGVTLKFKNLSNGPMGGGLGVASWSMTYTATGEELGL